MKRIRLIPGEECLYNGKVVIIKSIEQNLKQVWADLIESGESKLLDIDNLKPLPSKLEKTNDIAKATTIDIGFPNPQEWDKADNKKQIILEVERNASHFLTPKENKRSIEAIAKSYGLHRATVYGYWKKYRDSGRELRSLLEKVKGGLGSKRIRPEIEKIIDQAIESTYLTLQRNSKAETYQQVKLVCYQNNIKDIPSLDTLYRRINDLPQGTVVLRRNGEKKYREVFHMSQGTVSDELEVPYPLAKVEIDHTEVDIQLIDEFYGEPLGRPYLTIAVDVYSRIVLGFHLSFNPPSVDSIAQCIAHAICPKEEWLQQRGISAQWPCWGKPDIFRVDNALEFHSKAYKRACDNYEIDIQYRKQIEDGAIVERLIGTCMKDVHPLPGTTFSNVQEKGEYKSEKEATMTLKGFEKWFIYWVIEYNNTLHKSLGTSPLNKYLQAFKPTSGKPLREIPPYYTDSLEIRLDFSPFVERTIQRKGVVIDHIYYLHSCFKWHREDDPIKKHIFRRLPDDISAIWLFDEVIKKHIAIKYANANYPAVSLWELKAVRKRLIDQQIPIDEETIFRCVEARRAVVLEELSNRKNIRLTVETNRVMGHLYLPPHIDNQEIEQKSESDFDDKSGKTEEIDDDEIKPFNFFAL